MENFSYISIITNDDYIPGVLVLHRTLLETKPKYPFLLLITQKVTKEGIQKLEKNNINYKIIKEEVHNPTDVNMNHRWFHTYSKLHVFNQTEFEKIVYLDADMFILRNIDELFSHPHMSGTNAGSMIPEKSHWSHLNTGLMVIEPSEELFKYMYKKVGKIENLQSQGTEEKPKYGSDQDFLNAYFPNWNNESRLHLDHKFNIFHYHLDKYNKLFGYTIENSEKPIHIIHYASFMKPWDVDSETQEKINNDPKQSLEIYSIKLWQDKYREII